jgi:hypothetical protein
MKLPIGIQEPEQSACRFHPLLRNVQLCFRINALRSNGWIPSETLRTRDRAAKVRQFLFGTGGASTGANPRQVFFVRLPSRRTPDALWQTLRLESVGHSDAPSTVVVTHALIRQGREAVLDELLNQIDG